MLAMDLSGQTQDKALLQPLAVAQQDWASPELLQQAGQASGKLDAEAELAGLEEFFAREAVERGI
jgi:hypothetical protein